MLLEELFGFVWSLQVVLVLQGRDGVVHLLILVINRKDHVIITVDGHFCWLINIIEVDSNIAQSARSIKYMNYDQSNDRSMANFAKDDTGGRRMQAGSGSHARNKSYDFLLANKQHGKSATGLQAAAKPVSKSIVSMWGFINGLGVEEIFDKIGEIDEEIADLSFADGHVFLLTEGNNILVRGKNDSKQLGFDPKETLLSFKVLSVPSV